MRNLIYLLSLVLVSIFYGCAKTPELDKSIVHALVENYKAEHEIRKMLPVATVTTHEHHGSSTSGFFLFGIGTVSSSGSYDKGEINMYVTYAWCIKDSIYTSSTFPIEKIRIKLVSSKSAPTVSYVLYSDGIMLDFDSSTIQGLRLVSPEKLRDRWTHKYADYLTPQNIFDEPKFFDYVVITVNPKDWPTDISLPMNN